jgi:DNA-3-methyladenine glycosylase II
MKKAIQHLKTADPVIGTIIERGGPYKMQYRDPSFHSLARAIVYQQLNGKAALTIFNRLIAAAKADPLTPESILKLRPARMRTLGLSKQKMTYIRELARMSRDGVVRFDHPASTEDAAIIEHFTQVKGVGVWTARCS